MSGQLLAVALLAAAFFGFNVALALAWMLELRGHRRVRATADRKGGS